MTGQARPRIRYAEAVLTAGSWAGSPKNCIYSLTRFQADVIEALRRAATRAVLPGWTYR